MLPFDVLSRFHGWATINVPARIASSSWPRIDSAILVSLLVFGCSEGGGPLQPPDSSVVSGDASMVDGGVDAGASDGGDATACVDSLLSITTNLNEVVARGCVEDLDCTVSTLPILCNGVETYETCSIATSDAASVEALRGFQNFEICQALQPQCAPPISCPTATVTCSPEGLCTAVHQ